ncbi:hypothetical protein [Streptomyces sp. RKAG337]|nr:hypothetical protein [Streptomyces sp. RKAG337]MCM2426317.1 hypothetical protein [Streptomyces sp. RKAG337]
MREYAVEHLTGKPTPYVPKYATKDVTKDVTESTPEHGWDWLRPVRREA